MATKNIVPRANNEGNIGTSLKRWLKGFFRDGIYYDDTRGLKYDSSSSKWQYNNGSGWLDIGSGGGGGGDTFFTFNLTISGGVGTFTNLPSGWSATYSSGDITVTHNLNKVLGYVGWTIYDVPSQTIPLAFQAIAQGTTTTAESVYYNGGYNQFKIKTLVASNKFRFIVHLTDLGGTV